MRILWVKVGGLYPPDTGGKIRSFFILRELARRHEVTFASAHAPDPDDQHDELKRYFHRYVHLPLDIPPRFSARDYLQYARALVSPLPYSVAKYQSRRLRRAVAELAERESFDLLVCDFVSTSTIFPWHAAAPKVLFCHNVEARIWQRHYQVARNPLWKLVAWMEYQKMCRIELRYLRRADHVMTVSEVDRKIFSRLVSLNRLSALPTGVDTDYFQPQEAEEHPARLVFSGSMDWLPNEDAIIYFSEQILPLLAAQRPQVELLVVGRRPTARLQRLAESNPRIQLTGAVPDIRPFLASGAVYVVPLRVGGGTRLKIFEAMALGKAVVSTRVGAEGLPVEDGANILLADEPAEFAEKVLLLLGQSDRRRAVARAGRRLVEEKYGWSQVARHCEEIFSTAQSDWRNTSHA